VLHCRSHRGSAKFTQKSSMIPSDGRRRRIRRDILQDRFSRGRNREGGVRGTAQISERLSAPAWIRGARGACESSTASSAAHHDLQCPPVRRHRRTSRPTADRRGDRRLPTRYGGAPGTRCRAPSADKWICNASCGVVEIMLASVLARVATWHRLRRTDDEEIAGIKCASDALEPCAEALQSSHRNDLTRQSRAGVLAVPNAFDATHRSCT
jgi:hypothetical protein